MRLRLLEMRLWMLHTHRWILQKRQKRYAALKTQQTTP